ncbi:hypothetical protein Sjap_011530 [Stephania japonica]|uniref:Uncharacterized protein n=1 Tax=Stephania japonica TaxID=461633 RepID=A0AAP0JDM5_9MAGN
MRWRGSYEQQSIEVYFASLTNATPQAKKNNVNGGEEEVVKEENCIPKGNRKKDVVGKEKVADHSDSNIIDMTIMDDPVVVDNKNWAT